MVTILFKDGTEENFPLSEDDVKELVRLMDHDSTEEVFVKGDTLIRVSEVRTIRPKRPAVVFA